MSPAERNDRLVVAAERHATGALQQASALARIADALEVLADDTRPLPDEPQRARSWWRP